MTKPKTSSPKTQTLRWVIAGTLGLSLSAVSFLATYAAPGDPSSTPEVSPTTATTTNPVATATAMPSTTTTTTKPTAVATTAAAPTILSATFDTRTFTCDGICDHSTITAYIPNAPVDAWVGIQWFDSSTNSWRNVEGWQGNIDLAANTNQPFKQWTVFKSNFGQGPFRWVVQTTEGGSIWGISPNFTLPSIGGLNVLTFLTQPANAPVLGQLPTTNSASLTNAPMLNTNVVTSPTGCASPCDESDIAIYVPNAPTGAWVGIQWIDSAGIWHDVPGWQGSLDLNANSTTPFKQYTVFHNQLGAGPFHWVLYTQKDGSIIGVSPNFTLPQNAGQMLTTFVSSPASAQ